MSRVIVLVSVLYLMWPAQTTAKTAYTVDAIAEGLLAAEAQLTDLRLDYAFTHRAWNEPNGSKLVTEATYAHKTSEQIPQRLRYLERITFVVDPNGEHTSLREDILASFNGQATTTINRVVESGELMRAFIQPGYDSKWFGSYDPDPHTKIWYYGSEILLGDIVKRYKNKFHIESEFEVVDGISTIKLTGTWTDPYNGVEFTMKLWVSPERNFLPLKWQVIREDGKMLSETALYNLVRLPNGMWYPKTIRSPADPPAILNPRIAHIYNISEISIEPVPQDFFTPKFAPNTRVHDGILNITYTTY
jgi:hypothetical protein